MPGMTFSRTNLQPPARCRSPLPRALRAFCLLLLPNLGWAEGAVRVLDCEVTQTCDASGACAMASERVSFRMTPENLREDGSGQYQISYRNVQAGMEARSYAGPFYWTSGTEQNTLLASSETLFLWHRLTVNPAPDASVNFLNCTFQQ
jgi:hypothetical protein